MAGPNGSSPQLKPDGDPPVTPETPAPSEAVDSTPTGASPPDEPPIDVTSADEATLRQLPGVGPVMAKRIIEHREQHELASVDQLGEVPGIGPQSLERLRPRVTVTTSAAAATPDPAPAYEPPPPLAQGPPPAATGARPVWEQPIPTERPAAVRDEPRRRSVVSWVALGSLLGMLLAAVVGVLLIWRLDGQIALVQQQLATDEAEIARLAGGLDTLTTRAGALEGELETLAPRVERIERDAASVEGRVSGAESRVESLGAEVDGLGSEIEAVGGEIEQLDQRAAVFDDFLLGLRELAVGANPVPDESAPSVTTSRAELNPGEALSIRLGRLYPAAEFEIVLVDSEGNEAALDVVRTNNAGGATFQLLGEESATLAPGEYTLAIFPLGGRAPIASTPLTVLDEAP